MTPNLTVKTYTPGLTGWANLASEIQEVMDRAWRNGIEIQERERKSFIRKRNRNRDRRRWEDRHREKGAQSNR